MNASVKVTLRGYSTPAVSVIDDKTARASMVGNSCGERFDKAVNDVVEQVVDIVKA